MTRRAGSRKKGSFPSYEALVVPTLEALKRLGGSATLDELDAAVSSSLGLSEKQLQIPHSRERASRTELEYRLAWTRTMLKTAELVTNSTRGVWALTDAQLDPHSIDPKAVRRKHRELSRRVTAPGRKAGTPALSATLTDQQAAVDDWTSRILEVVQRIRPEQFERLALRVLREAGFIDLTVTGRIGDGGIDGKGIIRVSGVVSFHVVFQCKRYAGSVSGDKIRAFRGAMEGRADRGVFITSGRFTPSAKAEATREGARPIDLLDGKDFASMLKQFGLGVKLRMVEAIDIDNDWFGRL